MIDTHCHLDAEPFDEDRDAVLERARVAGITGLIVPGVAPDTWDPLVELATRNPAIKPCAGIHPQFLPDLPVASDPLHVEQLDDRLRRGGVVAVGECGLDGPSKDRAPMDRQVAIFKEHLRLARKHHLPAMAHCFRAHDALLAILEEEGIPPSGMVIHSYSGGPELVPILVKLGCHFGLTGSLTYPKARKPVASAAAIPLERLLLETDSPDQTPAAHRGRRNEPAFLPSVAEAVAQARGIPVAELLEATDGNARRLFALDRLPQRAQPRGDAAAGTVLGPVSSR